MAFFVFIITFVAVFAIGIAKFRDSSIFAKVGTGIIAFLLATTISLFTSDFYVVVEEGEVAVYRDLFNGVLDRVDGTGLHLKIPLIQKAEIFNKQTKLFRVR